MAEISCCAGMREGGASHGASHVFSSMAVSVEHGRFWEHVFPWGVN